jgi:AcrR family transcriptional regulator
MTGIARRAGVARQTVYNLFDSKAALLLDVVRAQVAGGGVDAREERRARVLAAPDPEDLIAGFAVRHREIVERTAPIIRVALQAAVVDPAVAEHLHANERTRVRAMSDVVDAVHARGALRSDVDPAVLRRGFAVLTSPSVAVAALDGGMTLDELEAWTRMTAEGLLLGRPGDADR